MSADFKLRTLTLPLLITTKPSSSSSSSSSDVIDNEEENSCVTPNSPQHMIPKLLICPPAPKKPQRRCKKRKLSEVEFFDVVQREEVESFFRVMEESLILVNNSGDCKRKRVM